MTDIPPRLRFAPSPTGYLHVGGARTALFNWLFARKFGGQMLLRIEDTDKARSTDESTRAIFTGLEWLGLGWDEDVVYQGGNLERHQADAERLVETGAAYRDFTPQDELALRRADAEARGEVYRYERPSPEPWENADTRMRVAQGEPHVIRFRVPDGDETAWVDLVHGRIAFPHKDIDDFVILRSDRTPIYNLAVVSDDIAMRITHVMRGDDHISNTPKQILLYEALGAELPTFAHLPMIHGTDGKKLSKRHGATAVGDYQHLGILPQAMLNFLALLGWSPGGDREVMSVAEMIELFSPDGLLAKAAVFDPQKLEWMNGQYLARLPIDEVAPRAVQALMAAGLAIDGDYDRRPDWYHTLIDLLRVRSRTIDDIVRQAAPFFGERVDYDPEATAKQWKDRAAVADVLLASQTALAGLGDWEPVGMESALRALADSRGIGAGKLFQPLRVALTGSLVSPGIFDVLVALGRARSLARIDDALRVLREDVPAAH